ADIDRDDPIANWMAFGDMLSRARDRTVCFDQLDGLKWHILCLRQISLSRFAPAFRPLPEGSPFHGVRSNLNEVAVNVRSQYLGQEAGAAAPQYGLHLIDR